MDRKSAVVRERKWNCTGQPLQSNLDWRCEVCRSPRLSSIILAHPSSSSPSAIQPRIYSHQPCSIGRVPRLVDEAQGFTLHTRLSERSRRRACSQHTRPLLKGLNSRDQLRAPLLATWTRQASLGVEADLGCLRLMRERLWLQALYNTVQPTEYLWHCCPQYTDLPTTAFWLLASYPISPRRALFRRSQICYK